MPVMMTMGGAPVSRLRSGPPSCWLPEGRVGDKAGSKVGPGNGRYSAAKSKATVGRSWLDVRHPGTLNANHPSPAREGPGRLPSSLSLGSAGNATKLGNPFVARGAVVLLDDNGVQSSGVAEEIAWKAPIQIDSI
jgi:hypothetical protein